VENDIYTRAHIHINLHFESRYSYGISNVNLRPLRL